MKRMRLKRRNTCVTLSQYRKYAQSLNIQHIEQCLYTYLVFVVFVVVAKVAFDSLWL